MFVPPPPQQNPPPQPEPNPHEGLEAAFAYAAKALKSGQPRKKVRRRLLELGLDEKSVFLVLSQVNVANSSAEADDSESIPSLARPESEIIREAGQRKMALGALWCIGGLIVTGLTYALASGTGGGTYIFAWGAILFGAVQFIQGLSQSSTQE